MHDACVNIIGDSGAAALAVMLAINTAVTELDFYDTDVPSETVLDAVFSVVAVAAYGGRCQPQMHPAYLRTRRF
jgi:hypothetical protein